MFILRQIFIALLIPISFLEIIMGCLKHPATKFIGIGSKILVTTVLINFIIEGGIIREKYFLKTNLVNRIRNIGWKACFTDVNLNTKFMKFPSVFSAT